MNSALVCNERGGLTHVREVRVGKPENRSDILAELRMTIDVLSETCDCHLSARANIGKLADMLRPGPETDALRKQIERDMDKLDAVAGFRDHVLEQVRSGSLKRLAELFDK